MKNSFLETIRISDGEIFNLSYHQARYESVLRAFGLTKFKNLADYIFPPQTGLYRCRVEYNETDEISVSYHPYVKREIHSLKLVYAEEIDYSYKFTDRKAIETLYAQKGDCDEVLIVKNSLITDTSIANIAFYGADGWLTPRTPLLKGTTRARLLDEGKIVEADVHVSELESFSKIALMNAMIDFDILENFEFLI